MRRARRRPQFTVEEATIDDIQNAIKNGEVTCQGVVQAYIDRAKAYNGVCAALVTADGKPIPAATGTTRAGSPLLFPTKTVAASSLIPNLDEYAGPPLELGRMEATASDPSVQQQYGMVVGIPNAGQLSAFETLNIRGERSVTCKGEFDAPPGTPLPAGAPAACEEFRKQPDALERAAELDALYGRNPDLEKMPMYCAAITVKNWYDVKDMRSTGGNDVDFAMDAPPQDMTIVAQLRAKGAIISGVTIASEVNFNKDGDIEPKTAFVGGNAIRSSWGGVACNPYDTERTSGGSSGGAGASVAANLATCSICETTGGSCRIPANANAVASFVTTKGMTSEAGSATADFINHRPGVLCRTLGDAARVIDGMKDPEDGFFDTRDIFTAQPRALEATDPFASYIVANVQPNDRPLKGLRVGIVREFMVKHSPNDAAISDLVDKEFKTMLRDRLGAELVESVDPAYPDDPQVPNMTYTFADAFSEILPASAPEYFFQKTEDGAARVRRARLRRDVARLSREAVAAPGAAVAEAEPAAHLAWARQRRPQCVHDREVSHRARRRARDRHGGLRREFEVAVRAAGGRRAELRGGQRAGLARNGGHRSRQDAHDVPLRDDEGHAREPHRRARASERRLAARQDRSCAGAQRRRPRRQRIRHHGPARRAGGHRAGRLQRRRLRAAVRVERRQEDATPASPARRRRRFRTRCRSASSSGALPATSP